MNQIKWWRRTASCLRWAILKASPATFLMCLSQKLLWNCSTPLFSLKKGDISKVSPIEKLVYFIDRNKKFQFAPTFRSCYSGKRQPDNQVSFENILANWAIYADSISPGYFPKPLLSSICRLLAIRAMWMWNTTWPTKTRNLDIYRVCNYGAHFSLFLHELDLHPNKSLFSCFHRLDFARTLFSNLYWCLWIVNSMNFYEQKFCKIVFNWGQFTFLIF